MRMEDVVDEEEISMEEAGLLIPQSWSLQCDIGPDSQGLLAEETNWIN